MRSILRTSALFLLFGLVGCDGGGVQPDTNPDATPAANNPAITDIILEPVFGAATGSVSEVGEWGPVLDWPHVAVSMANLPDGRVLTYSGSERRTWPATEQTYSATWDPETGVFIENFHTGHNMFCAALSMTSDGQVLVNGGRNAGNSPWTTLFDYRDNNWQQVQNMASGGRWYPTTLTLGDGKVMTALGSSSNTRNPDLWDADDGWRVLNGFDFLSMRERNNEFGRINAFPLLSLAPNGNVFHYWDTVENHMINISGSGASRPATPTTDGTNHAGGVQMMYDVGKLLVSGRNDGSWGGDALGAANNAFTVDLNGAVPDIRSTQSMMHSRKFHQLVPLPTSEVLVIGGNTTGAKFRDSGSVMEPEVWNPATGEWRGMADMAIPRDYHSTALLLTDGRVLTAGGGYDSGNPNSSGTHQDAQIFSPPYLFNDDGSLASRPSLTAGVASVDVGENIEVIATGDIAYFSLIKMSATTHAMNTGARHYRPEFDQQANGGFSITVNQNPNVSIPGYWMLFAVNSDGVPSEAQVIRITAVDTRLDNMALVGTATQSSTSLGLDAGNAIDGDLSGSEASGSITQTDNETGAWWEIDLGRSVEIDTIRLWNRTDCCTERLADFHVFVSREPFASTNVDATQNQNDVTDFPTLGRAGRQTDITVNQTARYVRVQLAGSGILQLAEVQVFGTGPQGLSNVAPNGVATQSSTYQSDVAGKANDGNTNSNIQNGSVAHTQSDNTAWWELDLGRVMDLDSVVVWNRTDCCQERFQDWVLLVSDEPFNNKNLDNSISQTGVFSRRYDGQGAPITESIVGRTGRYVRVQLSGTNFLQLAEVQVFGSEVTEELVVEPYLANPQQMGSSLSYTATASGAGTLRYNWNFGDGTPSTGFGTSATQTHNYTQPGRYVVSVTVRDANGDEIRETFTQVVHPVLTAQKPRASTSILEYAGRIWNVNPDNNSVSVTDAESYELLSEIAVGREPANIAVAPDNLIWVVNREPASVSVINPTTLSVVRTTPLAYASRPYGIVFDNTSAYIALEAIGKVVKLSAATGDELAIEEVGSSPRHLSINAAFDKLYVSRFITPALPGEDTDTPVIDDGARAYGGEIVVLRPSDLLVQDTIILEHSNRVASEHEGPGIPNYVGPAVISPAGDFAWVPSKQDNILAGDLRGGEGVTFDQTVRAITSKVDLASNTDITGDRVDHDNASVSFSSVFDPFGVTIFSSLEGNRQISVIDANTAIEIGRFDTGLAPQGMAMSADGTKLYVHNFMDRSIGIYDINDIVNNGATVANEIATVTVVTNETLDTTVLRGKQLFYDARDDRLAGLDYMSCASCHEDGDHDGRVWDFTGLGEGLRNTISLKGRSGMGHGILHWTGNFDELQDFEGQIREFAGGTGLMNDADFALTSNPLGNPKAGLSDDLDALSAYMASLNRVDDSPWRNTDGSMTTAAVNGAGIFTAKGCDSCHVGTTFTDSTTAALHDIGTIVPNSGDRLGEALTGLDTPTLTGVWASAPYLHDGSASTLQEAIAAHINITTTAAEQNDLATFLTQLDDGEVTLPPPVVTPPLPVNTNTAPNALSQNLAVAQGASIDMILTGSDSDGDLLSYEIADQPSNGAISGAAPNITYTPDATFAGVDSFTFTVNDGNATSATASIVINVSAPTPSNETTITLNGNLADWSTVTSFGVDPLDANGLNDSIDLTEGWVAHDNQNFYIAYQNESVIALDWGYSIYLDTDNNSVTGFRGFDGEYPVGADYLIEGAELQKYSGTGENWSWTAIGTLNSGVAGNTVELEIPRLTLGSPDQLQLFFVGVNAAVNGPTVDYYPDNAVTPDSQARFFIYTVEAGANSRPIASSQVVSTNTNTALSIFLAGSDADGDSLSFAITQQPSKGVLSGTVPNLVYIPNNNFNGADSFSFRVSDSNSNSNPAVVSINVGSNNGNNSNPNSNSGGNLSANNNSNGGGGLDSLLLIFLLALVIRRRTDVYLHI